MRSRLGASWKLLTMVGQGLFEMNLSPAVALEYEAVLKRDEHATFITATEVDRLIAYLCANSNHREPAIDLLPMADDPNDELVAKLVLAFECDYLVTHNVRHFGRLASLRVPIVTPREFLAIIEPI